MTVGVIFCLEIDKSTLSGRGAIMLRNESTFLGWDTTFLGRETTFLGSQS